MIFAIYCAGFSHKALKSRDPCGSRGYETRRLAPATVGQETDMKEKAHPDRDDALSR